MSYPRSAAQRQGDFAQARSYETFIEQFLGEHVISFLDSPTRLDFWVPGFFLDTKEKNQRYSKRFCPVAADEPNAFIIDELSVRKAVVTGATSAYFLLHDKVHEAGERTFLARVDEVFCAPRRLLNRTGPGGHKKGKWVVDLMSFRQLAEPGELVGLIMADQVTMPWKLSECLTLTAVAEA